MGMYTELIFGAALKTDVPESVIDVLECLVGDTEEEPYGGFPFPHGRPYMFTGGSYYFAVNNAHHACWHDGIGNDYHISFRCNLKNYHSEIEHFLAWIKPYISQGSGARDMFAVVTYEESDPVLHFLYDK